MTALLAKHHRRPDNGFTLIELLVVIIILGVLSAVVVFAVKGIGDKGESNAIAIDERTIRTALEAHCAHKGTYPIDPNGADEYPDPMDMLVEAKFLSDRSTNHKLETGTTFTEGNCDGKNYKLTPEKILDPIDPEPPTPPEWEPAGELLVGQGRAKAIVLDGANCGQNCGKVLVLTQPETPSLSDPIVADLYDPKTGTWAIAAPPPGDGSAEGIQSTSMATIRGETTGICGLSCGRVVVKFRFLTALYDPATGTWLTMVQPRNCSTTGVVSSVGPGKVLLVGGSPGGHQPNNEDPCFTRADLYDSATGLWNPTGSTTWQYTQLQPVVTLTTGKSLIMGGTRRAAGDTIIMAGQGEIYDPGTGLWTTTSIAPAAPGEVMADWGYSPIVPLPNGRALMYITFFKPGVERSGAFVYDPGPDSWTSSQWCTACSSGGTLTTVGNGKVLAAGGSGPTTELYDPTTGMWTPLPSLGQARRNHAAVLLSDAFGCTSRCGHVLVVAGDDTSPPYTLVSAESRPSR